MNFGKGRLDLVSRMSGDESHPCLETAPRVSVVLPVRNAADTLARAIDSIRQQTHVNWELFVVDDGSTDESPRITEALSRADPRIRLRLSPGRGIVAALNHGLRLAGGDFIARMDADDVSVPQRFARQVRLLQARPEIGLVGSLVNYGGDAEANRGYALHVDWINTLATPSEIALNRFVESPLAHFSVMFRREVVERFGGYQEGPFPEDYELWLRWMDAGVPMAKVPEALLIWNDPPTRLSRAHPRYGAEAFFAIKAPYLARQVIRNRRRRPVWIWGAGRPTRVRAEMLCQHDVQIGGYIDIDPKKWGKVFSGRPVVGPVSIPPPTKALVLGYVNKRGARELIRGHLTSRGYTEGEDFWMAA